MNEQIQRNHACIQKKGTVSSVEAERARFM